MATRVTALNSSNAYWNDYDIQPFHRDHVGELGEGVLNADKDIAGLQNKDFEYGNGIITADGWIGDNSSWYGFVNSAVGSVAIASDNPYAGTYALKIQCDTNGGSEIIGARLAEASSYPSFSTLDRKNLIRVKPNTTYRISAYIETDSISSGSSGGACLAATGVDEDGAVGTARDVSTYITGTNSYALTQLEFTTGDDDKYILLECAIDNETGTAWFDDLNVVEVGDDLRVVEETVPTNTVEISTGVGYIKINKNSTDYVARLEVTTAESVTIGANSSGNPRKDLIIAKIDTSTDPDATSSNVGLLEVVEGTPAVSPTVPATPDDAIPLAVVDVANGQTVFTDDDITDVRDYMVLKSLHVNPSFTAQDPASREDALSPATTAKPGAVKLSEDAENEENPVVVGDNDPRLLTELQKTQLINSLDAPNSIFLPVAENIDTSSQPLEIWGDADKVRILNGDTDDEVALRIGTAIMGQTVYAPETLDGFDSGDTNEYYDLASTTDHAASNTDPDTLIAAATNSNSTALAASNDTRETIASVTNLEYVYQLLEWDISALTNILPENVFWIEALVEAQAGGTGLSDGFEVYVWNDEDSTWEELGSSTTAYGTDSEVENTAIIRGEDDVPKYINSADKLYILIKSTGTSDGSNSINLSTDYAGLEVSEGIQIQLGGRIAGYSNLIPGKWYGPGSVGTYTTKQGAIYTTKSGTYQNFGEASNHFGCRSIVSDSEFAGWIEDFTIDLAKNSSGEDVVVCLLHQPVKNYSSDDTHMLNGMQVVYRTSVAPGSIASGGGEHTFTVQKEVPAGQLYLAVFIDDTAIDATNYPKIMKASTGGADFWDVGTAPYEWNGSVGAALWCDMNFISYGNDVVEGGISHYHRNPGSPDTHFAVSESEVILITPPDNYYSTDWSVNDSGNTYNVIEADSYDEIDLPFVPRRMRITAISDNTSANDYIFVVEWRDGEVFIRKFFRHDYGGTRTLSTPYEMEPDNWVEDVDVSSPSNDVCAFTLGLIDGQTAQVAFNVTQSDNFTIQTLEAWQKY